MEQFDLKGNLIVTAQIKAQIDDSPVALPPPKIQEGGGLIPPVTGQEDFSNAVHNNSAIMQEFGTTTSDLIKNLQDLNNAIQQNGKNQQTQVSYKSIDNVTDDKENVSFENIKQSETTTIKTVEPELVSSSVAAQVLTQPVVNNSIQNDDENIQLLNEAQNNSTETLKDNIDLMKEFDNILPDMIKSFRTMNDLVSTTNQNLPAVKKMVDTKDADAQKLSEAEKKGFFDTLNTGNNMLANWANGNGTGVTQSFLSGVKNATDTGRDIAKTQGNDNMLETFTKIGIGAMIAGAVVKGVDTLASKYIEEMPIIFGTGKAYGTTDNDESIKLWHKFNEYNKGTGLNVDDFQSLIQQIRKQGVGNELNEADSIALAGKIAQTTGRWAYATGGDVNQYAQLAGMMERFGGSKDVAGDFNYIVSAGKASGLNDTQIPEFISAIQKAMEDGIAKGFSQSATEVADTLLMFSKLSGNDNFWKGEQGARLVNQANSGIANAVALNKTEDILVYAAMERAYTEKQKEAILGNSYVKGADTINTLQMIERGIKKDNFDQIMDFVKSSYVSENDRVRALKNMTGLNITGASRLYNLSTKGLKGDSLETELSKIMDAPENKNNETINQENLNRIKDTVVDIGKSLAELKIAGMEDVSTVVHKIYDFLTGEENPEPDKDEIASRQESLILRSGGKVSMDDVKDLDFFDLTPIEYSTVFDSRVKSVPGGGTINDWKIKPFDGRRGFDSDNFEALTESAMDVLASTEKTQTVIDMFDNKDTAEDVIKRLMNGGGAYEKLRYKYQDAVKDANADSYWSASERNNLSNILIEILKEMKNITIIEKS